MYYSPKLLGFCDRQLIAMILTCSERNQKVTLVMLTVTEIDVICISVLRTARINNLLNLICFTFLEHVHWRIASTCLK